MKTLTESLEHLAALEREIAASRTRLQEKLTAYEATGDHDHGRGSLPVGYECFGGDCWVYRARIVLKAIQKALT